jgi:formylglycine-generating enzyme required for sulfatase activity
VILSQMKRFLVPLLVCGLAATHTLAASAQAASSKPKMVYQVATRRGDIAAARALVPGTRFRDCPECPEMTVIPPGQFAIERDPVYGGLGTSVDGSAPQVTIGKAFAIGIYDVTRAEYAAFVRATGRSGGEGCQFNDGQLWITDDRKTWRHPGFLQTPRDPVVCVSWNDAQAYIRWLNGKVAVPDGKGPTRSGPYRLLSGAEWLYAARAGATTTAAYYWGHTPGHDYANYGLDQCWPCGVAKQGKDRWDYTSPVGSFAPNAFGLYDIVGNVWQWTDDCYHEPRTVMSDGSSWASGDCNIRFIRGGSYDDAPLTLRIDSAAANGPYPVHVRNNANGFRVAKTID